ncbi:thiamine-phosphate kinase [Thiomicrorhabdus sp. Kp2]|uniref:thiamine-phosphate kinase n=1 Tax=Thiomicrorhabdus sp. Kp2 TaxID=1123518 RepID=UPI0003FB4DC5|nr:thiamine-phosphate kinase [Thiomicrorhabdus sp. Kp2]
MASEFELINTLFEPLSKGLSSDEIGIGDDGAVLNVPNNHQLVVVTDTLVSGVHFPENASAYDIAWKAVAVNLSDLAAMGAKPGFYSLALTIPNNDQAWLVDFAKGLADICSAYKIPLIGGDTTKGPLTITVTAQGFVERGTALKRSGAKVGDLICVTNTIGDGALGLKVAFNELPGLVKQEMTQEQSLHLLNALNRPEPQLAIGQYLPKIANSAIDISDGLLADLNHILEASNKLIESGGKRLSAKIELDSIPLSNAAKLYIDKTGDWKTILAGGDDYQLCFTLSEEQLGLAKETANRLGMRVSVIGQVVVSAVVSKEQDVKIELFLSGTSFDVSDSKGYLHF